MREAINNPQFINAIIFAIVFTAAALIYVRFYRADEAPISSASRFSRSPLSIAFLVVLVVALALMADRLHTYLNRP